MPHCASLIASPVVNVLIVFLVASPVLAQSGRGTIGGTVVDPHDDAAGLVKAGRTQQWNAGVEYRARARFGRRRELPGE